MLIAVGIGPLLVLLILIRRLPRNTIIKEDFFRDDKGGELRVFHRIFMEDNLTKDFFDKIPINLSGVSKYNLRVYFPVSNSLTRNFDPDIHQDDSDKVLSIQFFSKFTYRKGKVHYLNQQSEEAASDDEYSIAIRKSRQTTEKTLPFNATMIEMGQNIVERLKINGQSLRSETVRKKIIAYTDPFHPRSKLRGQIVFIIGKAVVSIPKDLPADDDVLM